MTPFFILAFYLSWVRLPYVQWLNTNDKNKMDDETAYKLLKLVQEDPNISQREIAHELGISLGKANYCLKAVMERGWVKAKNFYRSTNKRGYMYLLTNKGINEKARVTFRFLKYKMDEYEALETEIAQIKQEAERIKREGGDLPEEAR